MCRMVCAYTRHAAAGITYLQYIYLLLTMLAHM
jgi:hypothetical protein